jgi:hypothetical protein
MLVSVPVRAAAGVLLAGLVLSAAGRDRAAVPPATPEPRRVFPYVVEPQIEGDLTAAAEKQLRDAILRMTDMFILERWECLVLSSRPSRRLTLRLQRMEPDEWRVTLSEQQIGGHHLTWLHTECLDCTADELLLRLAELSSAHLPECARPELRPQP